MTQEEKRREREQNEVEHIWGGMSDEQRQKVKKGDYSDLVKQSGLTEERLRTILARAEKRPPEGHAE